jgi:Helix-turn-helix domain
VEHHKADARPVARRGTSGDDEARFLRELRQLRDGAGLGHAELAARAHYPYDAIIAAEVGPSLPDLPVLSAFVRGCGGTTEEWEERWRSLTESPSLPVSEARQSGRSDAANAGARINSATQAGDGPDPSIIIAALNRVAEEMATPGADVPTPTHPQPAPEPPPPLPLPAGQPEAGSKPAGWDPIRVSSAWPALKHTPTVAQPGRDAPVRGAGVPWDPAPQVEDPAAAASSAKLGIGSGARPAAGSDVRMAGRGGTGRSSRVTLVVVAVILLCVAAALLASFA